VAKHVCRRWLRAVFAAATESVGAEQNQQILGESSQGGRGFCLIIPQILSEVTGENRADSFSLTTYKLRKSSVRSATF